MVKVALLIGVSEYEPELNPLPSAARDVEAMQQVLQNPEIGGFAETEITVLLNQPRQEVENAIYSLFANRQRDDVVLLYFSGHGLIDEAGEFYLSTRYTRKDNGNLVTPTAITSSYIHRMMNGSRSRRQVVILDCCFSGAFARGMAAKDSNQVDVRSQLGGEGRAILTASTSTQYAFEQEAFALSIYTHFLVEGLQTGAADRDNDGAISVDELHEYVRNKVKEAAPKMTPEFYPVREGHTILLAKSPKDDPKLKYRKEAEQRAVSGDFSVFARRLLNSKRVEWGLSLEEAEIIETEVLRPYREYERKLKEYEDALIEAVKAEFPFRESTANDLKDYRRYLALKDSDTEAIESRILPQRPPEAESPPFNNPSTADTQNAQPAASSATHPLNIQVDRGMTQESVGVETLGGQVTVMIPRNTALPVQKMEVFSTATDGQNNVELHIVKGEREVAVDNISLGTFRLNNIPPAPRGVPQIEVVFTIDEQGILSVGAKDRGTGKQVAVTLEAGQFVDSGNFSGFSETASENKSTSSKSGAFSNIFEDFLSGFRGDTPQSNEPKRGDDLRLDLKLDLREAAFGGEKEIRISHLETCPTCNGSGTKPGNSTQACSACRGTTRKQEAKKLKIAVPAGVDTGTRLRVSGEGDAGQYRGDPGDLYIYLFVNEDPDFKRDGIDILSEVKISRQQAASGGRVTIKTIDGSGVLTIPPNTKDGAVLRLKNRGVPKLGNSSERGNHLITVKISP